MTTRQEVIDVIKRTIAATRVSDWHNPQGEDKPVFSYGRQSANGATMDIHVILGVTQENDLTKLARDELLKHGGRLTQYGVSNFRSQRNSGWIIQVTKIPVK